MGKQTQTPLRTQMRTGTVSQKNNRRRARRSGVTRVAIWAVLAVAVLAVAGIAIVNAQGPRSGPAVAVTNSDGMAWGPAGARVKIVEYANFGCPHCQDFALNQEQQLRSDYANSGQVRFEYKPFRLSDPAADQAANAAMCASDQGHFWQYHDLLFRAQTASSAPFTTAALKDYGAQIGLDNAQFTQCVDNQSHIFDVYDSSQAGVSQGVTGTPTFFVNGKSIVGAVPYGQLKAAIEAALAAG